MYNYKDKIRNLKTLNNIMLIKTLSMFKYNNLPDTLPSYEIENILQNIGYGFVTKYNNELYIFKGNLSGNKDIYGNYKDIIVNNTNINLNKTYDVNKDGVLICNNDKKISLIDIFSRYNYILLENDINIVMWGFNSRSPSFISAPDDKTKNSAELAIKKVIDGELSIIGDNAVFDGMKVHQANSNYNSNIKSMIELHQYIKASLYNEIGLNANFNMKRERLISDELETIEESLFPLVYNMLYSRKLAIDKINDKFNTNITIDFNSVWKLKHNDLCSNKSEINNSNKSEINNSNDSEINNDIKYIKDIINDKNSKVEDIKAAKELLKDIINNSNNDI